MVAGLPVERIVDDVSTLKALADPLRMSLVEAAMADPERTFTAKEFAAMAGIGPTKIYYHLNLLEQYELLRVRDTRQVNGIIEKHYGAGQRRLTFHRGRPTDDPGGVRELVVTMLDQVGRDIDEGLREGRILPSRTAPDTHRMIMSRTIATIPVEKAVQFRTELSDLVRRFEEAREPDGARYALLVAIHPTTAESGDANEE